VIVITFSSVAVTGYCRVTTAVQFTEEVAHDRLRPRSPKPAQPNDTDESIRRRAYELYEQRGRIEGFALDDWLQAEREILGAQKQGKVKAARGSQC
jgi:Protein of unknown function (DUF2934)